MNEATGPSFTAPVTQVTLTGVNFVQEALTMIGNEYALLSYVPLTARCVIIYVDGLFYMQGTHATANTYVVDGRKIQFSSLLAGGETVMAYYYTESDVADIPAVDISFDIPGLEFRTLCGETFHRLDALALAFNHGILRHAALLNLCP